MTVAKPGSNRSHDRGRRHSIVATPARRWPSCAEPLITAASGASVQAPPTVRPPPSALPSRASKAIGSDQFDRLPSTLGNAPCHRRDVPVADRQHRRRRIGAGRFAAHGPARPVAQLHPCPTHPALARSSSHAGGGRSTCHRRIVAIVGRHNRATGTVNRSPRGLETSRQRPLHRAGTQPSGVAGCQTRSKLCR